MQSILSSRSKVGSELFTNRTEHSFGAESLQFGVQHSNDKETPCVCLGDVLSLYFDDLGSCISSDGFVDEDCEVPKLSVMDSLRVDGTLFRVVAKQLYTFQKKLNSKVKKIIQTTHPVGGDEVLNFEEVLPEERHFLEKLNAEAEAEKNHNMSECTRTLGAIVNYGQVIQLQHLKSGKFLAIKPKEVAEIDSNCHRVVLTDQGSQEVWWILEPRYKLQNTIESINYGDSICLASVKVSGQYLHCAHEVKSNVISSGTALSKYEVNASDVRISWKLKLYTSWQPGLDHVVKGGDLLQISHVESESYLSYGMEKSGLCLDKSKHLKIAKGYTKKREHIDVYSLWQIEQPECGDGGFFQFGGSFRLRHIATNTYLAVRRIRDEGVPSMISEPIPQTLFKIHNAGQFASNTIVWDTIAYLQCTSSSGFLHPEPDSHKKNIMQLQTGREASMCDTFRLNRVDPVIASVFYEIESYRNVLLSLLPPDFGNDSSDFFLNNLDRAMYRTFVKTLKGIETFCSFRRNHANTVVSTSFRLESVQLSWANAVTNIVLRQLFVHEMGVLQLVIKMTNSLQKAIKNLSNDPDQSMLLSASPRGALKSFRDSVLQTPGREATYSKYQHIIHLFQLSHRALSASLSNNKETVNALGDDMLLIMQQLSLDPRFAKYVLQTVTTILSAKSHFVELMNPSILEHVLTSIDTHTTDRPVYVDLLSQFLKNQNRGIARNQCLVLKRFIMDKRRRQYLYETFSPDQGIIMIKNCIDPKQKDVTAKTYDLEALAAGADDDVLRMYTSTVELLDALCTGDNHASRVMITGGVYRFADFSTIMQCIGNERLPYNLRTLYSRLMNHLYFKPNLVCSETTLKTVFTIEDLGADPFAVFDIEEKYADMHRELKRELLALFGNHSSFFVPEVEKGSNEFSMSLIQLCYSLITNGAFRSESEIQQELVPVLICLLEPSTDEVKQSEMKNTFSKFAPVGPDSQELAMELVAKCKAVLCDMLLFLFKLQVAVRTRKLLAICHELTPFTTSANTRRMSCSDPRISARSSKNTLLKRRASSFIWFNTFKPGESTMEADPCHQLLEKMRDVKVFQRITEATTTLNLVFDTERERLSRILVELWKYKDPQLAFKTFQVLLRCNSPTLDLYLQIFDVQVLSQDTSMRDYKMATSLFQDLKRMFPAFRLLALPNNDLNFFDASQRSQFVSCITSLADMCKIRGTIAEFESQRFTNQQMLRRLGVHTFILDVIKSLILPHEQHSEDFVKRIEHGSTFYEPAVRSWIVDELLPACFSFIEFFSSGMKRNQHFWGDHTRLLSRFFRAGISVAGALSGIFCGNEKLCQRLDLNIIDEVLRFISNESNKDEQGRDEKNYSSHISCVHFLEVAFMVDGKVVRRTQAYILQSLSGTVKHEEDGGREEAQEGSAPFGEDANRPLVLFRGEREPFLKRSRSKLDKAKLQPNNNIVEYNMSILRLLRFLATDAGPGDMSIIRSILPVDRLVQDITGNYCISRAKGEMLHLFRIIYLQNHSDTRCYGFTYSLSLWSILHHLSQLLQRCDPFSLLTVPDRSHGGDTFNSLTDSDVVMMELEMLFADHWVPILDVLMDEPILWYSLTDQARVDVEIIFCKLAKMLEVADVQKQNLLKAHKYEETPEIVQEFRDLIESLGAKLASHKNLPFALPKIFRNQTDKDKIRSTLSARSQRRRSNIPKYVFRVAEEPLESLHCNNTITIFGKAFKEIFDQPDNSTHNEQEEEEEEEDACSHASSHDELRGADDQSSKAVQLSSRRRQEILELCKIFYYSQLGPRTIHEGQVEDLVEILISYFNPNRLQWERDVLEGLEVLRQLADQWQHAITEQRPPGWLLKGIPRLIIEMVSREDSGDRVFFSCLGLAITVLNISPQKPIQDSFFAIFTSSSSESFQFLNQLFLRMQQGEQETKLLMRTWQEMLQTDKSALKDYDSFLARLGNVVDYSDRSLHAILLRGFVDWDRSNSHVDSVFRFLHALCEGHNGKLQNFLRFQAGNVRSIDMVTSVADFIVLSSGYINPLNIEIVKTAILALAEMIQQPCRPNQKAVCETPICTSANNILNMTAEHYVSHYQALKHIKPSESDFEKYIDEAVACFDKKIYDLKASTITLLLALLECVDEPEIPSLMLGSLNPDRLIQNMNDLLFVYNPTLVYELEDKGKIEAWQIPAAPPIGDDSKVAEQEAEQVAEQFYITYITLSQFDESGSLNAKLSPDYIWDYVNLKSKIGVIEISRKGVLERAYFTIPKSCSYLTSASKHDLLLSVNRANLQTQLTDFSERFDSLYSEMQHQQKLTRNQILNFFRLTSGLREKTFFLNAVIINVLLLLFYNYECRGSFTCGDNEPLTYFRIRPGWDVLVNVLAYIQCILAFTRQWWYVIERGVPRAREKMMESDVKTRRSLFSSFIKMILPDHFDSVFFHLTLSNQGNRSTINRVLLIQFLYILTDLQFWMITVMTITNILALAYPHNGNKLFLVVHLFEIFNRSRVLQNVMKSITFRANTLLQTAGLAFIFIYFFGVSGFYFFPELFQFAEADVMGGRKLEPNNNGARCTSVWKCTLVVLDMGLRKGDLGEAMDDIPWKLQSNESDKYRILYRMLYTLLFFIIVTTILMNIIFGVIIDTFAELRARKDEIDRDVSGKCFICGIDRFIFDQHGEGASGFQEHIEEEHNMWKYLYFQVYLREKQYDEYSGGESYVFSRTLELARDPATHLKLIDKETGVELKRPRGQVDLHWFPQKAAMRLKSKKKELKDVVQEKIKTIQEENKLQAKRLDKSMDDALFLLSPTI